MKVFDEKLYADKFRSGVLFCRRVSDFRNMLGGRGDPNEGIYIPDRKNLIFDLVSKNMISGQKQKDKFEGTDFEYIKIQLHALDYINMFCMYAISDDESKIDSMGEHKLSQEMNNLGNYTVAIKDNNEFVNRIKSAAKNNNYQLAKGPITYYEQKTGMPAHEIGMKTLFYKEDKFEYQQEYRFAFDSKTQESNPICLNIGNIHDITMLIKTSDVQYKIEKKSI